MDRLIVESYEWFRVVNPDSTKIECFEAGFKAALKHQEMGNSVTAALEAEEPEVSIDALTLAKQWFNNKEIPSLVNTLANDIQSYAEAYHAKKCEDEPEDVKSCRNCGRDDGAFCHGCSRYYNDLWVPAAPKKE